MIRNRFHRGSLIDWGANGSVGGSDFRIIAHLEGHTVDVGGVDGHQILTNVAGWEGAVSTNNINPDLCLLDQYGNYKRRHVHMAESSETEEDEFFDSTQNMSNGQLSRYALYR